MVVLTLSVTFIGCGESGVTPEISTIHVSLLVQTRGEDIRWFRDVAVPKGANAYELTDQVTERNLVANYHPEFKSHFVEGIFGVKNNNPNFWLIWLWSDAEGKWETLPVSADLYTLKDRDVLAWHYTDTSQEDNSPSAIP